MQPVEDASFWVFATHFRHGQGINSPLFAEHEWNKPPANWVRQRRERVVRAISGATVSSRSPGQRVVESCLRTAGVGSTGKCAAVFIAESSGSVASVPRIASPQVAYASSRSRLVASAFEFVASASVASPVASASRVKGASRSSLVVSRSIVASPRSRVVHSASPSCGVGPVELSARSLRSSRALLRPVASREVRLRRFASELFQSSGVVSSPRVVLREAFQRLAETVRDGLSRRISRRLGNKSSVASHDHLQSRPGVAFVPVELRRASPARAWRLH